MPTLTETLGKVQSNAENNAVEELIKKLKGAIQEPPSTPAAPASPTPAASARGQAGPKRSDSAGAFSVDRERATPFSSPGTATARETPITTSICPRSGRKRCASI